MGLLDDIKKAATDHEDTIKKAAADHGDKLEAVIEKIGDAVDGKTEGKYAGKVDQAQDFVKDQLGKAEQA